MPINRNVASRAEQEDSDTTTTLLTDIELNTEATGTKLDTNNTKLDTLEASLTAIETDVESTNTKLDTINAKLVTGTVIGDVNLGATDNAVLDSIVSNQVAKATGGMSFHMLAMAAEDNDAIIKATAATVYFISVQSIDATPVYLKLFNAASITPGTTSADLQFMCPSSATGGSIVLDTGEHGIEFNTGLCALVSTGIAVDDNTAVSANEVIVTIGYE